MKIKRIISLALVISALFLTACTNSEGDAEKLDTVGEYNAPKEYNGNSLELLSALAEDESKGSVTDVYAAASYLDSAFSLFSESMTDGKEMGNVLISPLSVYMALSMTSMGAEGSTLEGMQDFLGDIHADGAAKYMQALAKTLSESDRIKLNIANSVWMKDNGNLTVNPDFIRVAEKYFSAESYKAPFDRGTLGDINSWIEEKTEGMIKDMLQDIPDDAVMYLINALAFEAEWQEKYNEYQVREGDFMPYGKKDCKKVSMMYSSEDTYIGDEGAVGFLKPYANADYAFMALLPDKGIDVYEYARSLTGEDFVNMIGTGEEAIVSAAIPEFKYEYEDSLRNELEALGMDVAFSGEADFTGIGSCKDGPLAISDVRHKTYIEMSPEGTKAGAATVVEMMAGSAAPAEEIKFYKVILDRPFVYAIVNVETGTPIFLGVLADIG